MTQTIYNPDGTIYMTLPDPVPSRGDLEGWTVRHVCSGTHGPACGHSVKGTHSLTSTDVESFNGLLKLVGEFSIMYGYRPTSGKITSDTFRWTWERDYGDGHRGSDMIIASKLH